MLLLEVRIHAWTFPSRLSNLLFNKPKDFAAKLEVEYKEDLEDHGLKPAWIDDDDEEFDAKIIPNANIQGLYKDALKRKYENLMGTPNWAKLRKKSKTDGEEDEEILRTVGHLQKTKTAGLPKDFIEIQKFPKITGSKSAKQSITCLQFHPTASVALVGSHLGEMSLVSIGGDVNNQLHSFKLSKFRPSTAMFTPDGSEAYIASKSDHKYYVYNLLKAEAKLVSLPHAVRRPHVFVMSPNGKYLAAADSFDEVFIISTASKELLRSLKHNNDIQDVAFSHDSAKLYSYCKGGEVCIWNLTTYRVIKKFYDHGCVTASCLAVSPCGRLLATGSGEGIVNIYETNNLESTDPLPIKTVENLNTKITHMSFNSATEILAISSSFYPNAVKLVHIPSYHVFANYPQQGLNLGQVERVSFSPNSGYMAAGNNRACAFLYRLKHYKNY